MNNDIMLIGGINCYEKDGVAYLNLEAVARGLGFTQIAESGNEVVRWDRVRKYLSDLCVPTSGYDGFIPENIFYRLAMKAKNKTAEEFQAKVADEIIPSIRKHGSYHAQPPMSPAQLIAAQAQVLVDMEQKMLAIENQQQELSNKVETALKAFSRPK